MDVKNDMEKAMAGGKNGDISIPETGKNTGFPPGSLQQTIWYCPVCGQWLLIASPVRAFKQVMAEHGSYCSSKTVENRHLHN